jgi:hypothetical protein
MNTIRIRKIIDSETLHLPELRPLIGRTVEITVEDHTPAVRDEFWAEAARFPDTEETFEAQKTIFRRWRSDGRFEPYWFVLDELLNRTFDRARQWAALQAQLPLDDYDYDAIREQDACDLLAVCRGSRKIARNSERSRANSHSGFPLGFGW